jgi:carboxypeptidase T
MRPYRFLVLVLLFTLILAPVTDSAAQTTALPTGPALVRIYFNTQAELQQLASGLDIWEVHRAEGWLLAYLTPEQVLSVRQTGLRLEVDDAATRAISTPRLLSPDQGTGIPGFACYRTVEQTDARLAELVSQYPTLASTSAIGQSWIHQNTAGGSGYNLNILKLTNSQRPGPKPTFFLMAEIHAREYTTAETALRFAEYLLQNYGVDPDVTWLLDSNEIDIVPMTNPDGRKQAETGLLWRKNLNNTINCPYVTYASHNGVDLNRNSSFGWGSAIGSSPYPCDETFMGSAAASEPETKAIEDYVTNLFPDRRGPNQNDAAPLDTQGLFITLHSYGPYVLWPYGDTISPSPNQTQLQTLGRKLAYYNHGYPGQSATSLYLTSGSTDDFAYGTLGVPAYTFEMGTSFFEDCTSFESSTWPNNRDALKYAFKATRSPYQAPAGPELTGVSLQAATLSAGSDLVLLATATDNHYSAANGTEPSQNIQAARFSIDLPSWAAGVVLQPMTASDGAYNSISEAIRGTSPTTGMTPGRHIIFIEAQDAAGHWGVPSAVFLNILVEPYSVSAVPVKASASARVGSALSFHLTVTNTGTAPDIYTLSTLTTTAWDTQLSSVSVGPLEPGAFVDVTVTVQIPPAPNPSRAATVFKAQSQGSATVKALSELTTQAVWLQFIPLAVASP